MKVSEFLAQARDELFKGWTKNAYHNGEGQVCAIGAIERVALSTMAIEEAARAQAEINAKAREIHGVDVVQHLNDAGKTSKQDMLDLFDKTVIGLEERGE
jgi:hypothetical protein